MTGQSAIRLLILSALWGGSFLFMRMVTPILGPAFTVEGRVGFAALFLFGLAITLKKNWRIHNHWQHYAILGFFNSALPFFMLSFATLTLTVSQTAILNATSPVWAFIIGVFLGNEKLTVKRGLGLAIGILGVMILFLDKAFILNDHAYLAILAALCATISYGIATNYAKKAKSVEPFLNAYGSMVFASIFLIPALFFLPIRESPSLNVIISVIALGILCSGVAYILYFRLIADIGATSALTVTFLVPIFASIWGFLILNEALTIYSLFGMVVILFGTSLVTEFNVRNLFPAKIDT